MPFGLGAASIGVSTSLDTNGKGGASAIDRLRPEVDLSIIVTPDLIRGPAFSSDPSIEQILPIGIAAFDQRELPLPVPTLDALFVRDAGSNVVAGFSPYEAREAIFGTEIGAITRAVLMDAGG